MNDEVKIAEIKTEFVEWYYFTTHSKTESQRRNRFLNKNYLVVLLEFLSLIDEHDRYIVFYGISKFACVADQFLILSVIFEITLTRRTGQNFQQVFIQHCYTSHEEGIRGNKKA